MNMVFRTRWIWGVSLFVGQAEGHIDGLIRDLAAGTLQQEYDYLRALPDLRNVPMPAYDIETIKRSFTGVVPIETSRGCPFRCTFCCIPNTQGVEMQMRDPQAIADYVRDYASQGVKTFFLSDDNIARNKRWEEVFDKLIEMRRKTRLRYELIIEADTVAYKIPRFIEKATAAGVTDVFLGLESIDPETIKAAGKKHNRAANVRDMFAAWYEHGAVTISGFIIGFPGETEKKIYGNVETLVSEYPGEIFTLSVLTPLPGSVDHKRLDELGTYMDPDLNNYDLGHFVFDHDTLDHSAVKRLRPSIVSRVYSLRRVWSIMLQGLRNPVKPVTNFSWTVGLTLGYRVGGTGVYENRLRTLPQPPFAPPRTAKGTRAGLLSQILHQGGVAGDPCRSLSGNLAQHAVRCAAQGGKRTRYSRCRAWYGGAVPARKPAHKAG